MANEVRAAMLQTRWTGDKESMFQRHEAWKHLDAAGLDGEIVISAPVTLTAILGDAQTPPFGT